jgi:hypothetical protein
MGFLKSQVAGRWPLVAGTLYHNIGRAQSRVSLAKDQAADAERVAETQSASVMGGVLAPEKPKVCAVTHERKL